MSYILDALKKSERERKQGEIPNLQSVHGAQYGQQKPTRKIPSWIWLAGGIVLSLSAFALYWGTQRDNAALQEKLVALESSVDHLQKQPAPDISSPTAVIEDTPLPPANSKGEETTASATMSTTAGSGQFPVAPEMTAKETVAQPLLVESDQNTPLTTKTAQVPEREEETVIPVKSVAPQIEPEEVVVPSQAKKSEGGAKAEEALLKTLPQMQDLSPVVQKSLPTLKLAGHVYAKERAKRMVIINNRICREGDLVENQLVLEHIIWEGVVFKFQEIRFRMNL